MQQLNKEIEQHQQKINDLHQQRDSLEKQLEESLLNEENTKFKLKALEEVLERLQNGISKLESSGSRETVLKEQVERLEQQLVELHENSALLKQELSQLKTKHWRMEKELENAEIDKRILQRELKDCEKQIKMLTEEIECLKRENEEKSKEINDLKERMNAVEENCTMVGYLKKELDTKQQKIEALLCDLTKLTNERSNLEKTYVSLQDENANLQRVLDDLRREKAEQSSHLQNTEQQMQNIRLNLNALRDACVILENQLEEYERLCDAMSAKEKAASVEREKLLENLTKTQEEVREAKRAMNEEKSLRLLAETKCKRLADDLQLAQKEKQEMQMRYEELKEHAKGMSEELNVLQGQLSDLEVTVNAKERTVEELSGEVKYLKESNSGKLTLLQNLRESNHELKRKLEECEVS